MNIFEYKHNTTIVRDLEYRATHGVNKTTKICRQYNEKDI